MEVTFEYTHYPTLGNYVVIAQAVHDDQFYSGVGASESKRSAREGALARLKQNIEFEAELRRRRAWRAEPIPSIVTEEVEHIELAVPATT